MEERDVFGLACERQVLRPQRVDPVGGELVGLGPVDVGEGGGVDHDVRLDLGDAGRDSGSVRDVQVEVVRDDLVSGAGRPAEIGAELSVASGKKDPHNRHNPTTVVTGWIRAPARCLDARGAAC